MLYKVLSIPNECLYQVSTTVELFDRDLRILVSDLFETMYHAKGVGLAAVQIAILKRVLVIDLEDAGFTKGVFINPRIIAQSKELDLGEEACLSVPEVSSMLNRPLWVEVEYHDIYGELEIIRAEKLMARALLHEMDHLDGKVYIDLLEPHFKKEIELDIKRIIQGEPVLNRSEPAYRKQRS